MPRNRWPSRPLAERFWEKVEKTPTCWVWIGAVTAPGQHGLIWVSELKRRVIASRVSWEMHYGPIPDGMEVCHRCDNPPCVRPDHLFLGTHTDNMRDAVSKGRSYGQTADWSLCKSGHALAETAYTSPTTGRRRCRVCVREGQRLRYAALTPAQRSAQRERWPRAPLTPEQRARRTEQMRGYREKRRQTPESMRGAARKLGEAMG